MYKNFNFQLNPPKNISVLCVPKIPSCKVTFSVEVYHQVLEYVHECCVGNSTGGGSVTLAVDECYGLSTNVENQ